MQVLNWLKEHPIIVAAAVLLIGFYLLVFTVSPEQIVRALGAQNGYLVAFLVAAIGGVSTLTGTALYATIATLAAGGLNPLLLGLVGGLGIFISNSIFFLLAYYGRRSVSGKWYERAKQASQWLDERFPRWAVLLFAFIYLGLSPFPDDILMVGLVIAGFTYKQVVPVLLAGGVTLATITAFLGEEIPLV